MNTDNMDRKREKRHPLIKYKFYILSGFLLLSILIYLFIVTTRPSRLHFDIDELQIVEVEHAYFRDYLEVEGFVQPKMTVKLHSVENGIVEQIVADAGSLLKEGDTLLLLSNPILLREIEDERDAIEKQRILYEEKKIQMKRKSSELKRNTLKTIYELERLNKQYELDKEEYKIGIKSKAQLSVASDEYDFNQANTRLLIEELQYDSLMSKIQTEMMRNDLLREEKRYLRSRQRAENLIVRTPLAGQLSYINVIPGERVVSGNTLGELKMIDDYKITTKVSEYYLDRISIGLAAYITYQNKKYELRITKINPEIKERLFEVDLVFAENKPDNIRIGKNYRIQIELGQPEEALVMEKGSFYQNTGGQWVFMLNKKGNKAFRTDIVIGRHNPRQYELLDGLEVGDRVIVSGYDLFENVQELILK